MPARPRKDIVDPTEPGFYHCYSRCVRRAFLCGDDSYTGKNYDHRKDWIETRLDLLASQMAIEVTGTAVMDNHLHVVVKIRPDIVIGWSDQEVARRWLKVCPGERQLDLTAPPIEPTEEKIAELMADKVQLGECRKRLASLSWMMKLLKEQISRSSNHEDQCTGAFWEGRFKSTRLLDLYALVLCSMYVDLNPIRAKKATTPETSLHTSAYLRIKARLARSETSKSERNESLDPLAAAWLSPIDEDTPPPDGPQAARGRRASDQGFLPMTLDKYLLLLDWSGRQLPLDKRGAIPQELAPILSRLELAADHWLEGLQSFQQWFSDFAGRPATLRAHAAKSGIRWIRGMR